MLTAARDLLGDDRILIVKGRVDHKQEGETKLIALDVAPFEGQPDAESEREVRLRVDARRAQAGLIRELAEVTRRYPGEASVVVALETHRRGPDVRVRPRVPRPPRVGLLRRGEGASSAKPRSRRCRQPADGGS